MTTRTTGDGNTDVWMKQDSTERSALEQDGAMDSQKALTQNEIMARTSGDGNIDVWMKQDSTERSALEQDGAMDSQKALIQNEIVARTSGGGNTDVWMKPDSPESSSLEQDGAMDSQKALTQNEIVAKVLSSPPSVKSEPPVVGPKWRLYIGVAILTFVNLLNYMDRYTIAGVLMDIQGNFKITNAQTGLLQTVFIISYMVVAPLFGYLGDRFNRIWIMAGGVTLWSGLTLLSSFIYKREHFLLFLLSRALVGIGEASYATIAPTLIGDMFAGSKRTRMLSVFYLAIPIGSGLGYIVGSAVAEEFGGWEWALRVTPGFGVFAILLLVILCPNPPRGASEASGSNVGVRHSYFEDLKYLIKNKSFIFVTLGFTAMAFVIGSLTLWAPTYISYSQIAIGALPACLDGGCSKNSNVSFIFGIVTCIAGIAGVGVGAESARRWKLCGRLNADALVCAIALVIGAPLLFFGIQFVQYHLTMCWILIFFADMSLCTTWTLISDMTLYVTEPHRRSTANAAQLLVGHLFGDAGSPYLLGVIADVLTAGAPDTYMAKYLSLQKSIYVTLFVCVLGSTAFFAASFTVVNDKRKVITFNQSLAFPTDGSGTAALELDSWTNPVADVQDGIIPTVQNRIESFVSDHPTEDLFRSKRSTV